MARQYVIGGIFGPSGINEESTRQYAVPGSGVDETVATTISLALAATEAPDVAAFTIVDSDSLALAATEAQDTASFDVTVSRQASFSGHGKYLNQDEIERHQREERARAQAEIDAIARSLADAAAETLFKQRERTHKRAIKRAIAEGASLAAAEIAYQRALQDQDDEETFLLLAA